MSPALAHPSAAEPFADGLLDLPIEDRDAAPVAPPQAVGDAAPSALDRFLWTLVKDADEEAIMNFWLTRKEGAKLHALERKKESERGLNDAEKLEHFDLNIVRQVVPLLKVAVEQKRSGWKGETSIWGEGGGN